MASPDQSERQTPLIVSSAERQMISEVVYILETALYKSRKRAVIPLGVRFSEVTLENVTTLKEKLNTFNKPLNEEVIQL